MLLNTTSFLFLAFGFHSILEVELVVTSLFSILFVTQMGQKHKSLLLSSISKAFKAHIHGPVDPTGVSAEGAGW